MDTLYALLFGLIQGLTEFLPISSSSHLTLLESALGIPHKDHILFLTLHLGTALATCMFLSKQIWQLKRREIFLILLAILPLLPGYLLIKWLFPSPPSLFITGCFLMINGVMLYTIGKPNTTKTPIDTESITDVLWIGAAQTLALFSGLSRSGWTIFAALRRNWTNEKSVLFSYLLSLPTILGGCIVETKALLSREDGPMISGPVITYGLAFLCSFLVGSVMIRAIFPVLSKGRFMPFALYSLVLGSGIVIYEKIIR